MQGLGLTLDAYCREWIPNPPKWETGPSRTAPDLAWRQGSVHRLEETGPGLGYFTLWLVVIGHGKAGEV